MRKALMAAVAALALGGSYACGSTCQDAADKAKECNDAMTDEEVTAFVDQCEKDLEGDAADDTQKCIDCVVDTECDAIVNGDCADSCTAAE